MAVHSYEEIRRGTIEVLSGREHSPYLQPEGQQFGTLMTAVADVLQRWEGRQAVSRHDRPELLGEDRETFREVFWDLFREGVITLGLNDSNREFPFFSLSRLGRRITSEQEAYFFHDVSSYEKLLRENVPAIDPATLVYLKEAMQSFKAGCVLASTVILGVAAEHTFSLVAEAAINNPAYGKSFEKVKKAPFIAGKLQEFREAMETKMPSHLDAKTSEGLEAMFNNVQELIRDFRNKCGHPTGTILGRETVFVLLQLFVPYCRKAYEVKAFFENNP